MTRQGEGPGFSVVVANCWACGRTFTFNPFTVPSIPIDPETKYPPDMNPRPGGMERAVRQPVCETCVELANERRRSMGLPLIEVIPGAYDLLEGVPGDD